MILPRPSRFMRRAMRSERLVSAMTLSLIIFFNIASSMSDAGPKAPKPALLMKISGTICRSESQLEIWSTAPAAVRSSASRWVSVLRSRLSTSRARMLRAMRRSR